MLVLNKINLINAMSYSLTLRVGDSVEQLLLNKVSPEDVTEDMIVCAFSESKKELIDNEGLVLAEVIDFHEDDGDYYVASGTYEGVELDNLFFGLEFIYSIHMGTYMPVNIESVEMDYQPVTLSPVRLVDTLGYHELIDEYTNKILASMFLPKQYLTSDLSDESAAGKGTINIAYENHMFYQYFGLVTLKDGTNKYASFDVAVDERQTSALMMLQNDIKELESLSGIKINFIADGFTVHSEKDEFVISSTLMLIYPFVNKTEVLRYKSVTEITSNPFNLDEDSVSTLIANAAVMDLGELKHLLTQNVIESI
jgi:hypothetical protein